MSLAVFKDLCMDAADATVLGTFWSAALGLELHRTARGTTVLTGPSSAHTVWINQVPEPRIAKHRIHLDVHGSSVDELLTLGASVLDGESFPWVVMADPEGGPWDVLADPEGNEFCLFGPA